MDAITGKTLSIHKLSRGHAQTQEKWMEPIIDTVNAHVLFAEDVDPFKTAVDENGMYHQVCKSHVACNTDALFEQLQASLAKGVNQSWKPIGASIQQALLDLKRLKDLIHLLQPESSVN